MYVIKANEKNATFLISYRSVRNVGNRKIWCKVGNGGVNFLLQRRIARVYTYTVWYYFPSGENTFIARGTNSTMLPTNTLLPFIRRLQSIQEENPFKRCYSVSKYEKRKRGSGGGAFFRTFGIKWKHRVTQAITSSTVNRFSTPFKWEATNTGMLNGRRSANRQEFKKSEKSIELDQAEWASYSSVPRPWPSKISTYVKGGMTLSTHSAAIYLQTHMLRLWNYPLINARVILECNRQILFQMCAD